MDYTGGGDTQQYRRKTFTKIKTAYDEMSRPSLRMKCRRGFTLGTSRYDEDVWQAREADAKRSQDFEPHWQELDEWMDRIGVHYIDELGEKYPDQTRR